MTFDQPLFAVLLDQSVALSNWICQQLSRMKSFQPKLLFKLGSLPQRHSVHQQGLWNVPEHHKIQSLFFAKNDQKENTYLDLYWIAQLSDLNMTISGRVLRENVQLGSSEGTVVSHYIRKMIEVLVGWWIWIRTMFYHTMQSVLCFTELRWLRFKFMHLWQIFRKIHVVNGTNFWCSA